MVFARLQAVLAAEHGNDGIGVPVAHLELLLKVGNLLHVGELGDLFELLHPMLNRLAVLLLNRREVRRRTGHLLFSHARILVNLAVARGALLPAFPETPPPLPDGEGGVISVSNRELRVLGASNSKTDACCSSKAGKYHED